MINLELFWPSSVSSRTNYRLLSAAFFLIALGGLFHSTFAQNSQPRPVARLIGGSAEPTKYTAPGSVGFPDSADEISKGMAAPAPDEAGAIERRAFAVTNEVRVKHGLAPLAWDPDLSRMARAHSRKMANSGVFSHETPEGLGMKDRARAVGIRRFKVLAENIAYNQGYDDPGAFTVERWMISSEHRSNILSQEFQASAIGSFVDSDGRVYLTQAFISR